MPILTDEQKLERKVISRFKKAIYTYNLIEDNDSILIGLSGGKDSLCLLEMLSQVLKIKARRFSVQALHIRMENVAYSSSTSYLEEFCLNRDIKFHVKTTSFEDRAPNKSPCFPCSWNRRKQLFQTAQALGCNKIALGHHMDDIIHTMMLNLYFQGSFSSMPVKLKLRKMPLTIIRPLCLQSEEDLKAFALIKKYELQTKRCPYEKVSLREKMRDIFSQIERSNPEARYSVWEALSKENKLIEGL
ncbi:MAG: tRNA 2-thiocytidine biosynthesis TtcA family protein [Prevotella sp.]|nr:tRNA 2-thiocytidine biosynthesis TtcA family protein [Prevotella sp.]